MALLVVKRDRFWKRRGARQSSKLQAPSSRETPNSKLQEERTSSPRPSPPQEERGKFSRSGDAASDFHKIGQKWLRAGPWILANSLAGQTFGVSCMQKAFETTPTGLVLAIIAMTPIVLMPQAYGCEGERPTK